MEIADKTDFVDTLDLESPIKPNIQNSVKIRNNWTTQEIEDLFNLSFSPSIRIIQLVAILLVIFQEIVYVLTIHVLAYSLFPRLKSTIPDPPPILNSLVDLNL